jgi:hypothetical protein
MDGHGPEKGENGGWAGESAKWESIVKGVSGKKIGFIWFDLALGGQGNDTIL